MGARGGWGAVSKGEEQLEEPQDDIRDQSFMQFHVIFQHYRHIILIYNINYIIFQIIKIILKNPKPYSFLNIFTTYKMLRYFNKMKFPSRKKTQIFLEPWSFSHCIFFFKWHLGRFVIFHDIWFGFEIFFFNFHIPKIHNTIYVVISLWIRLCVT